MSCHDNIGGDYSTLESYNNNNQCLAAIAMFMIAMNMKWIRWARSEAAP